jgi:hypothetical protein
VLAATALWIVLVSLYVSTNWRVYELSYKPPIKAGARWNVLWFASGRIAWSRFDPARSLSRPTYSPPSLRLKSYARSNGSWFWKPYRARQAGGWYIGIPVWIPLAPITLIGPLPVVVAAGHTVWSRLRCRGDNALCEGCGYNLAGLPEPTCPECGRKASTT